MCDSHESARMESSFDRVMHAAEIMQLEIDTAIMPQSTRTAEEAAQACGCDLGQIVKSLVFERSDNSELVLVLVSGSNNADMNKLQHYFGTELVRAEPKKVRSITGFAIGGVSPIGHKVKLDGVMDEDLVQYDYVWAAAGKPDAVFKVNAKELQGRLKFTLYDIKQRPAE